MISDNRADELAFDPEDSLILAVNNADEPPFATFIRVDRNTGALSWVASVSFADATNGAEQPVWHPGTGRFYISIPEIGRPATVPAAGTWPDGAVKRINPSTRAAEATYPVRFCQPAGLTVGPNGDAQVNPVWFSWDGERVAFSMTRDRQKFRNIARSGRAVIVPLPDEFPR